MHKSSYDTMEEFVEKYLDPRKQLKILDMGSYDVNGSYKNLFSSPNWEYVGADIVKGPNVDIVLGDPYDWEIPSESFDVVVSGQCLEHVKDMNKWIIQLPPILKINGLVCITAPWSWPEHRHPVDCWRIMPDGMRFLLKDVCGFEVLEVFKNQTDCFGIAKKINRNSDFQKSGSRDISQSGVTDNPPENISFDEWKSQMPKWLEKAFELIPLGRKQEAAEILNSQRIEQVLKEQQGPERIFTIFCMALLLHKLGQLVKAEELCKEILSHSLPTLYNELAVICEKTDRFSESIRYLSIAMQKYPNEPLFWSYFGDNLMRLGQKKKGIELLRKGVKRMPENSLRHSNFLFHLHNLSSLDWQQIFDEHKQWAQAHASVKRSKLKHNNVPDPNRKLRIGYISPDFRTHPVGMLFEPLLESHNRQQVEVYGYGNVEFPDKLTKQFKLKFDHYRYIHGIDDAYIAAIIEKDRIDILVDLAGHTRGNRLGVLAYKPAPIQVTYLGYLETTGMEQIDYFLTDDKISTPQSQQFHTEELIFLPQSSICYKPLERTRPAASFPVFEKGYITFGVFADSFKINQDIISLWATILKNNENSRILLLFNGGQDKEITGAFSVMFEQAGIPLDRVDFRDKKDFPEYLSEYEQVDIILDTYPYNNCITICDALWMEVPVVSLVGEHHMSRIGLSILTCVGLESFLTSTPDEYVAKANALAATPDSFAEIRALMRNKMAASNLCNGEKFAMNVEHAYQEMWHQWCKTH